MEKIWYKDWRSWVTIVLLIFVPTFLIGVIFMWITTPWNKKTKIWITAIGLGIPLVGIILSVFLASAKPTKQFSASKDAARRAGVQEISTQARRFCLTEERCPVNTIELKQKGYMREIPVDPDTKVNYFYQTTDDGNDCLVQAVLSSNEKFSRTCISQNIP